MKATPGINQDTTDLRTTTVMTKNLEALVADNQNLAFKLDLCLKYFLAQQPKDWEDMVTFLVGKDESAKYLEKAEEYKNEIQSKMEKKVQETD